jgi:hypothetical protein
MMKFKALHVPALTEEVAINLKVLLGDLPGIEQLRINLDNQELYIVFDETQLAFRSLSQEMAKAGCPLRNIGAAVLL